MGVPVRVWPRAPQNMIKINFIFDKTAKSKKLKSILLKKYKNYSIPKCEVIVVGGGDGFMLNILKKYQKFKIPFYGINCGSFGFLMNPYTEIKLENKIVKSKKITINPLIIKTLDKKNKIKKIIAINEISIFRQSKQTSALRLSFGKKIVVKKLVGDGVLVSTPAGSTAYNLSINGPILTLNSGKLAVTPISPFRPRRWKGKIILDNLAVSITNLDFNKRPVAAVADNIEVRNIKKLNVKINKKIKINILYDKNRNLTKKIRSEKIRKNTS